jgi:hypothetical protein
VTGRRSPNTARRHRTTVRLTGIALRQQGSHDSLCAYYAAAMLLCALRPELDERFEAPRVGDDPLFRHLPRRAGRAVEQVAAEWLTSGVRFGPLARALNGAAGPRTRFRFRRAPYSAATFELLRARIDQGLPCVLGWETREMGNHSALVVGYERYARSASRWLRLLDPIRSLDALEWGQLGRLAIADAELILCDAHDGVRPDRLTTERDAAGALLSGRTRIDRWEPSAGGFRRIV